MNTKTDTTERVAGHTPRVFGFDGFGINGCDLYASRLATLTEEGHRQGVGHLLAAAPELLEALKEMLRCNKELGAISRPVAEEARAAIAKAEGK